MLLIFRPTAAILSSGSTTPTTPPTTTGATSMSQGSAALVGNDITLGNATIYYAPQMADLTTAKAATTWRKMGMMKSNLTVNGQQTTLDFVSGVPASIVKRFITGQDFSISGDLLEFRPENLALALGSVPITHTLATTPTATAVAATPTPTKSVFGVTSATGLDVDDFIQVGTQFGRIQSIATNVITLYEGLSADALAVAADVVTKVGSSVISIGDSVSPANVAIKMSHAMASGNGSYDIYILKAQFNTDLSLVFQDNNKSPDGVSLPFTVTAYKDSNIENGKVAHFVYTYN